MADIKSFEGLSAAFENRDFERVLKGRFHRIPPGSFQSELSGVSSITVVPVPQKEHPSFNVTLNYETKSNQTRHATFTMFDDGVLSGRVPSDLGVSKEEIKREVIRIMETIRLDFWHVMDIDILSGADVGEHEEEEEGLKDGGRGSGKEGIDPKRLAFLEQQQAALFGFVGRGGFNGYIAVAFQNPTSRESFVVLENQEMGNAVYIVPLEEPVAEDPKMLEKLKKGAVPREELDTIIERVWIPIAEKAPTRQQLRRKCGATRIFHSGLDWMAREQEVIDSHLQQRAA